MSGGDRTPRPARRRRPHRHRPATRGTGGSL